MKKTLLIIVMLLSSAAVSFVSMLQSLSRMLHWNNNSRLLKIQEQPVSSWQVPELLHGYVEV